MDGLLDGAIALVVILLGAKAQSKGSTSGTTTERRASWCLGAPAGPFLDAPTADVRGHHHQTVAEGHHAALAVGEPTIIQELQERVEDVRVSLSY